MSGNTKHTINNAFTSRLTPVKTLGARPVNPFAVTGKPNAQTFFQELDVRPSIAITNSEGCYQGHCFHQKHDDSIKLDRYAVTQNPNASTQKHAVSRIDQEHTRER